jgi:hypothetical protein
MISFLSPTISHYVFVSQFVKGAIIYLGEELHERSDPPYLSQGLYILLLQVLIWSAFLVDLGFFHPPYFRIQALRLFNGEDQDYPAIKHVGRRN